MKLPLLFILATLLLAGCASPTQTLSNPNACLLLGKYSEFNDWAITIAFTKLDGADLKPDTSGKELTALEVAEGKHTVTLRITSIRPRAAALGDIEVSMLPGRTYQLKATQKDSSFVVTLTEAQGKESPKFVQEWLIKGVHYSPSERSTTPWDRPNPSKMIKPLAPQRGLQR